MTAPPDRTHDEEAIAKAEADYLINRSRFDPLRPRAGLALSGGGIRSATLSLGVLTALSRLGLVGKFDYLSTVSGGGYTGAFFTSFFVPAARRAAPDNKIDAAIAASNASLDPLGDLRGQRAIRHLRENGRYLSSGSGDAIRLAAITLRGWFALHAVIGMTLVAVFLFGNLVQAMLAHLAMVQVGERKLAEHAVTAWLWPLQWLTGHPAGEIWLLSPLWPITLLCLWFVVVVGWAFWLTRFDARPLKLIATDVPPFLGPATFGTVFVALACTFPIGLQWIVPWLAKVLPPEPQEALYYITYALGFSAIISLFVYMASHIIEHNSRKRIKGENQNPAVPRYEEEDRLRNRLTRWMAWWMQAALICGALAAIHTIAQTLYCLYMQDYPTGYRFPLTLGAVLAAALPLVRQAITSGQGSDQSEFWRRWGRRVALAVGLLLGFAIAVTWATLAEYLAWRGAPIGGGSAPLPKPGVPDWSFPTVVSPTVCFMILALVTSVSIGFLNLSTFSAFYAGRLRRAYLGASNDRRFGTAGRPVENDCPGDDIAPRDYYEHRASQQTAAPLHLINCTLNETCGVGGGDLVQRDRKGRPLTLSPAGFLYPEADDRLKAIAFSDNANDDLPLSRWVAISGAALSPGLGQNTSLGIALLAGLANLRLGVWWERSRSRLFNPFTQGVQRYLINEFTAKFRGIRGRRWYLTDGGHFENTGVYELVRRRVPLIVLCDNGADPAYKFEDIANLTRKLRIDFNATLEFLPEQCLNDLLGTTGSVREIFGEISQLERFAKKNTSYGPYAAIARIRIPVAGGKASAWSSNDAAAQRFPGDFTYTNQAEYLGTLIVLKPRLCGLEMLDLLDYHKSSSTFPQQSTSDQFFDEAQWESYFRLGATIADFAFAKPLRAEPLPWSPFDLLPIDPDFDWITAERLPASTRKSVDTPATAAAQAVPLAATTRGGVFAAILAALATGGVAAGVTQSLTTTATDKLTSTKASEQTVTLELAASDRELIKSGVKVDLDAKISQDLNVLVRYIDTLARDRRYGDLIVELRKLSVSIQNFRSNRNVQDLAPLLAEVIKLKQLSILHDDALQGDLTTIENRLTAIKTSVEDTTAVVRATGPRVGLRTGR